VNLRDELSRHLAFRFESLVPTNNLLWPELANEVIRQMEWARKTYLDIAGDGPEPGGHNCDEACYTRMNKLPLTLAPEDWKPE
jgi:hypothetical protein